MIKEFKEFALKGNLVDMAVAFVLGVAFAALVNSLVADVITPIVAAIFGQPDFSRLAIRIGNSEILYGSFLNAVITFLLVALALFLFVVKPYNVIRSRFEKEKETEAVGPAEDIALLTEIRDALRQH